MAIFGIRVWRIVISTLLFAIALFFLWDWSSIPKSTIEWNGNIDLSPDLFELLRWKTQCWSNGSWQYYANSQPLYINRRDISKYHSSCISDVSIGLNASTEMQKWRWTPLDQDCPVLYPSASEFCNVIGKRNILLIGDSLNMEVYYSIINLLATEPENVTYAMTYEFVTICPQKVTVLYIRNDLLSLVSAEQSGYFKGFFNESESYKETSWIDAFESGVYSIVLFNTGTAHYRPNEVFLRELGKALQYMNHSRTTKPHLRNVMIVFENSPAGHENCSRTPLGPVYEKPRIPAHRYNWDLFYDQNKLAEQLLWNYSIHMIDIWTPSIYRPDLHSRPPVDCLHYCLPGPPDTWTILFYNYLRELKLAHE